MSAVLAIWFRLLFHDSPRIRIELLDRHFKVSIRLAAHLAWIDSLSVGAAWRW